MLRSVTAETRVEMATGLEIRLRRILQGRDGRTVMIPMDHGVSVGPIEGLEDPREAVAKAAKGGASAVVLHKGLVPICKDYFGNGLALIVHLSASMANSPQPNRKILVGSVEEAIALGADAISVHTNLGEDGDVDMVGDLGSVTTRAHSLGFPVLCMAYPRGRMVKNPYDVEVVKHAARLGAEVGADLVKTNYTGSPESFKEVVKGCPVPIIIAGGPKMEDDRAVLEMVHGALQSGAKGVSIGRNVFQHRDPVAITRAISRIVFDGASVDEVYRW